MHWFSLLLSAAALTCTSLATAAGAELWAYVSIYKENAAALESAFEAAHPGIDLRVFQAGSEKIQAKVEAELVAKKPVADLVAVSDPFWCRDLEKRGLAWTPPGGKAVETNYHSLMVIAVHKDLPAARRPASFADLAKPELKGLVQMGSPLESGTVFTAVAFLSRRLGWDYFAKLRDNGAVSAGGNSAVIQKLESGEKKAGIVLLENVLAARKRKSPIEAIYPAEGAVPVESCRVVLASSKQREAAAKFGAFLASAPGQKLISAGHMHPASWTGTPPEGAKSLADAVKGASPWTEAALTEVARDAKDIKKKFSAMLLE